MTVIRSVNGAQGVLVRLASDARAVMEVNSKSVSVVVDRLHRTFCLERWGSRDVPASARCGMHVGTGG
jgi:hypothetical protein